MPKRNHEYPFNDRKFNPAATPEEREQQLGSLAMDLVEYRLRAGTATSQETCYFLERCCPDMHLRRDILEAERDLKQAKTEAISRGDDLKAITEEAIKALQSYRPSSAE